MNAHISPYAQAGRENPDPRRERKLLLHRAEIARLGRQASPSAASRWCRSRSTSRTGRAKVELGLARGKKRHDKRETITQREQEREIERASARRAIGRTREARRPRMLPAALRSLAGAALRCGPLASPSSEPFHPTRFDYQTRSAARASADEVREPNYLPFMAQPLRAARRRRKTCSSCAAGTSTRFPLTVYVAAAATSRSRAAGRVRSPARSRTPSPTPPGARSTPGSVRSAAWCASGASRSDQRARPAHRPRRTEPDRRPKPASRCSARRRCATPAG